MSKYFFLKIFKSNPFGHGGEKRSYQLEYLVKEKFKTIDYHLPFAPFIKPCLSSYLKTFIKNLLNKNLYRNLINLKWFLRENIKQQNTKQSILDLLKKEKVENVIWENSFPEYYNLPKILKEKGVKKVIACPHNLESFIDQKYVNWGSLDKTERLKKEIASLSECDLIFTISEEEQWLLENLGLKAHYLPYYPEGECFEQLLNVRKKRIQEKQFQDFLILGSATNTPTFEGMKALLAFLCKNINLFNARFIIAGFGTEVFKELENEKIICLGSVSDADLTGLMKRIKAIIIHQGFSSGALTKIPEFLVAGIPVISDKGSSRSFQRFDGLYVFQNHFDLIKIINKTLFNTPLLPQKPNTNYQEFITNLL